MAERLSAALGTPVDVTPVIVVLAPALDVLEQPADVQVVGFRDIPAWFQRKPHVLELAEASRVYRACRRNDVWVAPVESLRSAGTSALLQGLTLNVWRRGGHDRLYVNDADRKALGYLDRKTGEVVVNDPARQELLTTMLAPHVPG